MSTRPTQHFVKGQTLLQEGSLGDRTYRIISGEVVICKKNADGNLVPIAKLGTGELLGEMYLFEATKSRTATAIAVSAEVVVEIYFQEELQGMLDRLSSSAACIFHGLSLRLQHTSHRYVSMAPANPITQLPDGTLRQNSTYIRPNSQ